MSKRFGQIETFQKGYNTIAMGILVANNSSTGILTGVSCDLLKLYSPKTNTDTVWLNLSNTANSGTGFPLFSASSLDLPFDNSDKLYIQSQGGSSVVNYIALRKVVE
jgi:hypothetical protein